MLEPHFVRKGNAGRPAARIFPSIFSNRTPVEIAILRKFLVIELNFV